MILSPALSGELRVSSTCSDQVRFSVVVKGRTVVRLRLLAALVLYRWYVRDAGMKRSVFFCTKQTYGVGVEDTGWMGIRGVRGYKRVRGEVRGSAKRCWRGKVRGCEGM